ncbi:hypothetical protein [Cellulomonas carbonis]|uniref:hypothetical protein n=1 Tax=Cellulomonas carbonis TaxID=1386092 RepID=UPI001669D72F|nr:hypothetical protein [Cellulomonas carbonis]GGC17910.1 hypothetical protein GCM10010972_33940 [Cellulomonas carbonis]
MTPGDWITLAAVVVAIVAVVVAIVATVPAWVSLRFTRQAAAAASAQTELQRQVAQEARLPLLWADVRPDEHRLPMMLLVVGNSGPTVARDVRVVIEPRLRAPAKAFNCDRAQDDAAAGITALPPGRVLSWTIGLGPELLEAQQGIDTFTMTLTGTAADGTPLADSFAFRLEDLRYTDATAGPAQATVDQLKHVVTELRTLVKKIE